MSTTSNNPLVKYFRQPQLYLKLPTKGQWWSKDSLELPVNGEIPIFPMTARDELLMKTPDALMNGQGTVEVIESCCPAIKNAWEIPLPDLDAVLISIRQATYGNQMDVTSACPACNRPNEFGVDLSYIIDKITCPDYETTVRVQDLEIYLRPIIFRDFNDSSLELYEQQKLLAIARNESIREEDKIKQFQELFTKLVKITVSKISKNVAAIKTADILVDDQAHIEEFFNNCNKEVWTAVKQRIEQIAQQSEKQKRFHVKCTHEDCATDYDLPLQFENSHFFD